MAGLLLPSQYLSKAESAELFTKFTHGIAVEEQSIPSNVSLISGPWYIEAKDTSPTQFLSRFNKPENQNKIPMLYTYLAAGNARSKSGLGDCNIGLPKYQTLCYGGANYIRNNREELLNEYITAAYAIKQVYPQKPLLIQIEPDFYQYNSNEQSGGGLSFTDAHSIVNSWTDAIKSILPNARLVMDVSPWNQDLEGYSKGFRNFDYAGIVGKRFDPNGDGQCGIQNGIDCKTYNTIVNETGKKLILNDSFGPGGGLLSYNYNWQNRQLVEARWKDGVVAVILPPNDTWSLNQTAQSFSDNQVSSYVAPITPIIPVSPVSPVVPSAPTITNPKVTTNSITTSNVVSTCSSNNIVYSINKGSSWNSGMMVYVTIKNNSKKTINGWKINLGLNNGQKYLSGWNHGVTMTQNGVILKPSVEWNRYVKPGQTIDFGFEIQHSGNSSLPKINSCLP